MFTLINNLKFAILIAEPKAQSPKPLTYTHTQKKGLIKPKKAHVQRPCAALTSAMGIHRLNLQLGIAERKEIP